MNAYIDGLRRTLDFTGRMSRKNFIIFHLVNFVVSLIISMLVPAIGFMTASVPILGLIIVAMVLAFHLWMLVAGLSSCVRRLHDIEKSGWWMLIAIIPLINLIFLIWLSAVAGDDAPNYYGEVVEQK